MKLKQFLERLPDGFASEILQALPGPDRKDLLRQHGAKVSLRAGSLKRSVRQAKESRILLNALRKTDDLDAQRTYLQGWLARRADMIVHFLDAWEVEHTNGIVEHFDWVEQLTPDKVRESLPGLKEKNDKLEDVAPLVYFAYLELPCTEEVLDVDALLQGAASATTEEAKAE
ncbi:MAG: hypothetical protein AB7N76_21905 [Planctomycetota bacterium]